MAKKENPLRKFFKFLYKNLLLIIILIVMGLILSSNLIFKSTVLYETTFSDNDLCLNCLNITIPSDLFNNKNQITLAIYQDSKISDNGDFHFGEVVSGDYTYQIKGYTSLRPANSNPLRSIFIEKIAVEESISIRMINYPENVTYHVYVRR
jgi:hypothetical protein